MHIRWLISIAHFSDGITAARWNVCVYLKKNNNNQSLDTVQWRRCAGPERLSLQTSRGFFFQWNSRKNNFGKTKQRKVLFGVCVLCIFNNSLTWDNDRGKWLPTLDPRLPTAPRDCLKGGIFLEICNFIMVSVARASLASVNNNVHTVYIFIPFNDRFASSLFFPFHFYKAVEPPHCVLMTKLALRELFMSIPSPLFFFFFSSFLRFTSSRTCASGALLSWLDVCCAHCVRVAWHWHGNGWLNVLTHARNLGRVRMKSSLFLLIIVQT